MEDKFRVLICSDLNYEEMVADVVYEDHTIAIITQENGVNNMEIEIFPPEETTSWSFPLDSFIDILEFAKKNLIEMQKPPDDS